MKRLILPIVLLIVMGCASSFAMADGEDKGKGSGRSGGEAHRQKEGNRHRHRGGHRHGRRRRPNWGFGMWAPPVYPYPYGGYYRPFYSPVPPPPQPYLPYGGYYNGNGDFGFFFNF